jgi:hypothetical protein
MELLFYFMYTVLSCFVNVVRQLTDGKFISREKFMVAVTPVFHCSDTFANVH